MHTYDDYDDDCGCSMCGKLSFIYAQGSTSMCEDCARVCDELEEENGGMDKCMCCGRYKYGNQLNAFQVCIKGCVNPNEY